MDDMTVNYLIFRDAESKNKVLDVMGENFDIQNIIGNKDVDDEYKCNKFELIQTTTLTEVDDTRITFTTDWKPIPHLVLGISALCDIELVYICQIPGKGIDQWGMPCDDFGWWVIKSGNVVQSGGADSIDEILVELF